MDNNNVNNVPVGTPVEPVTPVTPVQPEPVVAPTPVTPAVPVTPVTPTPVEPVTPVVEAPNPVPMATPVAPEPMASPVPEFTPATNLVPPVQGLNNQVPQITNTVEQPVAPTPVVETPVAPVPPTTPVEPALTNINAPQPVQGGYVPPVVEQPQQPKKNNTVIIIVVVILAVAILGVVALLSGNKDDKKDKTTTTTVTTTENRDLTTTTTTKDVDSTTTTTSTTQVIPPIGTTTVAPTPNQDNNLAWNQAQYKNVTISFPATKDSFNGTGWTWDSTNAERTLKTGYTTSGGRIGSYPGGVVVSVVNMTGQDQLVKDCKIDAGTFYNPKDGSEDVRFIGGIHYGMQPDQVKAAMANKGFKKLDERPYEDSLYLKYQFNAERSTVDYIEFYFYKGTMNSVTIDVDYTK